jgi:16S rRNA (uracil1498-N3)-methyltransferase
MSRTPRFVVPVDGAATGAVITLPSAVAHQALRVMRLRPGDRLELLGGNGGSWNATLDAGATRQPAATATLGDFMPDAEADRGRHVTLVLGLLKADKFDWVVQKATEVGVARIVPVVTSRSVAMSGRADRWRRIAMEATEQSGRTVVPMIDDPMPFRSSLAIGPSGAVHVACWEAEKVVPFREGIASDGRGTAVVVWVGPEGGMSIEEVDALRASGAITASLGPRILRSETAAIIAVASAVDSGLSST